MRWTKSLPQTLRLAEDEVFACHGSPAGGDLEYLLEDVRSGRAVLAPDDAIRPRSRGSVPRASSCAAIHICSV